MNNNKIILPVLKDVGWAHADKAVCRPLTEALTSPYLPWLAFGYDHPHTFEFLSKDKFPALKKAQLDLIEQAAFRNFGQRQASWTKEKIDIGLWKKMLLLICADDFLAAERILDSDFMLEAESILKTEMLLVGIPRRGVIFAIDGTQNKDILGGFANMISTQYYRAETAPITPMCFILAQGKIVGMLKGGEEFGKTIVEAEDEEAEDAPYINGVVALNKETGIEAFHIFAGGPNIRKLVRGIESAFINTIQSIQTREAFGGQIYIRIISDITPVSSELEEAFIALEERLAGLVTDMESIAAFGLDIEVILQIEPPMGLLDELEDEATSKDTPPSKNQNGHPSSSETQSNGHIKRFVDWFKKK